MHIRRRTLIHGASRAYTGAGSAPGLTGISPLKKSPREKRNPFKGNPFSRNVSAELGIAPTLLARRLYVGNLAPAVSELELKRLFREAGHVDFCRVMFGRGFGFVQMESEEAAEAAIRKLNSRSLQGRSIRVSKARVPKGTILHTDLTNKSRRIKPTPRRRKAKSKKKVLLKVGPFCPKDCKSKTPPATKSLSQEKSKIR